MFKPLRFNPLLKALPSIFHRPTHPYSHEKHEHPHKVEERVTKTTSHEEAHVRTHTSLTSQTHETKDAVVTETIEKTTSTIAQVHGTTEGIAEVELTPPHPPREETAAYERAHRHMVFELDTPCAICGVRHSTLEDPRHNPFKAQAIETHHYPIERSLLHACDPRKVSVIFPNVKDYQSLEAFVDSEDNLMVLCDIHHRHPLHGIHHLTPQDFFIQPFLLQGYQIAAEIEDEKSVAVALEHNQAIVERVMKREKIDFAEEEVIAGHKVETEISRERTTLTAEVLDKDDNVEASLTAEEETTVKKRTVKKAKE